MSHDTQTSKPQGCTNLKLRQLSRRVSRLYDEAMEATGLKGTQYSLLSHVVLMEPVRPSDLAARLALDASTLTRNLQPLVAQGWVEIGAGADGRSRLVSSTEAGRAKRQQGQRAWKQAQMAINACLGSEQVVALHALLDDCATRLEAATEHPSD